MTTQIITNPDGTRTFTVCEDCPNGYPPQKPLNAPAASSGGGVNGWVIAAIVAALAIFGLLFGLIDRKLSEKPPQVERTAPFPKDSGIPISMNGNRIFY